MTFQGSYALLCFLYDKSLVVHYPLMQRDTFDLPGRYAYLPSCYYFCAITVFAVRFCSWVSLQNIIQVYLEWLCFWASNFSSCNWEFGRLWKSCGHSSLKRFPLHLWQERSFLCNGEDTKFCFERLITCYQTRKKGIKRLVEGRNSSILWQTLWKETEQISLIFNRP